jgi:hypothetical protein
MRAFLRWVLSVVGVLAGVLLAAELAFPEQVEPGIRLVLDATPGRIGAIILAVCLVSSPLVMLLRWLQALRRSREISYQTDNGRISVNLVAIEEALTRVLEGESDIRSARVAVYEDRVKRGIVIDAVVSLWEVPNVTERNLLCQRLLRRRFAELMPERSDVQVNLAIHRLVVRPKEKPSGKGKASLPVPAPAAAPPDEIPAAPSRPTHRPTEHLPVSAEPNDDDLYVGPSYPVTRDGDEEQEATGVWAKPKKR